MKTRRRQHLIKGFNFVVSSSQRSPNLWRRPTSNIWCLGLYNNFSNNNRHNGKQKYLPIWCHRISSSSLTMLFPQNQTVVLLNWLIIARICGPNCIYGTVIKKYHHLIIAQLLKVPQTQGRIPKWENNVYYNVGHWCSNAKGLIMERLGMMDSTWRGTQTEGLWTVNECKRRV